MGIKPGESAPKSGQYEVVGPRGGRTGKEVTLPKGHTAPPTQSLASLISWLIQQKTSLASNAHAPVSSLAGALH